MLQFCRCAQFVSLCFSRAFLHATCSSGDCTFKAWTVSSKCWSCRRQASLAFLSHIVWQKLAHLFFQCAALVGCNTCCSRDGWIFAVIPVSPEIPRFFCFFDFTESASAMKNCNGLCSAHKPLIFSGCSQESTLLLAVLQTVSFLVNNQSLLHKSFLELHCRQKVVLSSCWMVNHISNCWIMKSHEFLRKHCEFMSPIAHGSSMIYSANSRDQNQWSNTEKHTLAASSEKMAKKWQNELSDDEVKWIFEKTLWIHVAHRPWKLPDPFSKL